MQLNAHTTAADFRNPQIPLFEAFLHRPTPALLAQEPHSNSTPAFSEITLRATTASCLSLLAPVLRELSQLNEQRWLTLVAPPAAITAQWLREAGLNRERILILQPKTGHSSLELCCQALRLGCSHTVISWLKVDPKSQQSLEHAATTGHSQLLNIAIDD